MHPRGNYVFSVEGDNFHSDVYAQPIVTSIFGLCVKRKRMVRERDYRHAFCFLFSDRQMAGFVTDPKNRCPAKSWRDLQSLCIDILTLILMGL